MKRKEAKEKNLTRYFTGKQCKNNHLAERRTINGICIECEKIISKKYVEKKLKEYDGEKYYYTDKPCKHGHVSKRLVINRLCYECSKTNSKKTRQKEHSKKLKSLSDKKYYFKNKEKIKNKVTLYKRKNKGAVNNYISKRKKKIKQAIPKWANQEKIKEIYLNCADGYQVDHIIPLQGKLVCGLHVENNLQYLTPYENQSKGNKFEILNTANLEYYKKLEQLI